MAQIDPIDLVVDSPLLFPVPKATFSSQQDCGLEVDAGPDTNVCFPGGLIQLMGSITGNDVFFEWSPADGLNNIHILNPTADVDGPITYTLTAFAEDPSNPELIVNGNFEDANIGFSSQYNYVVDIPGFQMEMFPEGTYTVINNPNLVHSGFSPCTDHTSGTGQMMVINGAANLQDIWCQTVDVSSDTYFNVSAWVASVNPTSPAQLQFSINGNPIGNIITAPSATCIWVPFNAIWYSGSSTTAEICILNLNTALGGNDFALDDISMIGLCSVSDEVEITLVNETAPDPVFDGPDFVCEGDYATYTATFPPDPPIETYHWTVPVGAVITSGQGTAEITVHWITDQQAALCLEIHTRCDENEACYDVTVGTVPDLPVIIGQTELCPGETATLYTNEQDPDDTYMWTVPSNVEIISGEGTNEIDIEWAGPGEAEVCVAVTNACGTTENCMLINLYESYNTIFDTVICEGSTFEINGHPYGNGVFSGTEYFVTLHGCDSVVEVEVTESDILQFYASIYLCPGDSVFLEGEYQFTSGIFIDSFQTSAGCDSLQITEVILSAIDSTFLFATTCDQAQAGVFIQTFEQGNCDSIVIREVTYVPPDTVLISGTSCNPADTLHSIIHLVNQLGCDSVVIMDINLLMSDTIKIFLTSCNLADVGLDTNLLTNLAGCDSLIITNTAFSLSDTTVIDELVCMLSDTGTATNLLTNLNGCDSLVIFHSTFAGSDTTFLQNTTCMAIDSGWSYVTQLNASGCDSILATYTQWFASDTTYIYTRTCTDQDTGIFIQQFMNVAGCDSSVITHTYLIDPDSCTLQVDYSVQSPLCYGDPAILTVNIQSGVGPFQLYLVHLDIVQPYDDLPDKGVYMIPVDIFGTSFLVIHSATGLEKIDTILLEAPVELSGMATIKTDFNGFGIPCFGDSTGEIEFNVISDGTPPLSYTWSDGSTTDIISNLAAGNYMVTVTDANGCTITDTAEIISPPAIDYQILSTDISCFGAEDGSIQITNLAGGVPAYLVALDAHPFSAALLYTNLLSGIHTIIIEDQNACAFAADVEINEPADWHVDLGPDTIIQFGQSLTLDPKVIGNPYGSLHIDWSDGECTDCFVRTISPAGSITIGAVFTDNAGCIHSAEIQIRVELKRDLYVPNIFSPNHDQVNDVLIIYSNPSLEQIEWFRIYDRWGDLVFEKNNFQPNDPAVGWDGTSKGVLLNPAVFTYQLKATYKDGHQETRFGDITLVR